MAFQDKVVWITGASSGIGKALTHNLYKKGAKLILSARRTEQLRQVKRECGGDESEILVLPLDLTEPASLPEKAKQALEWKGKIDYLFNNGGISQRSLAMQTDMDVLRRVMEVNFFGTVALTKEVLPAMIEQQSGHIIVTSSVVGKFGTRLRSGYASSKHALHGYFDSLRQEVITDNITVSIVCPGFIKTDVSKNMLIGNGQHYGKMAHGQENGMLPQEFVEKLLPKVAGRKEEIYIGGKEIVGIYIKRWMPATFYKFLRKMDVT